MYRGFLLIISIICSAQTVFGQNDSRLGDNGMERAIIENENGTLDTVWVEKRTWKEVTAMDSLVYYDSIFRNSKIAFDTSKIKIEWQKTYHFIGLTATFTDTIGHNIRIVAFKNRIYDASGELRSIHLGLGNRLTQPMKKAIEKADKGDLISFSEFYVECNGHIFNINRTVGVRIN